MDPIGEATRPTHIPYLVANFATSESDAWEHLKKLKESRLFEYAITKWRVTESVEKNIQN